MTRDRRAYNKAYREANKEKIAAQRKAYYEANKEQISEKEKEYRKENLERIRAREREYNKRNRKEKSERNKKWREENAEYRSEYNKKHWSEVVKPLLESDVKKFIGSKIKKIKKRSGLTIDDVMQVYEKQNGKCALTRISMTTIFNDHASISIDRIDSKVGYTPNNIQLVCKAMNLAKQHHSQKSILEFVEQIRSN